MRCHRNGCGRWCWRLGCRRRCLCGRLLGLGALHDAVERSELVGNTACGLFEIADRLFVLVELQICHASVVIRVVVDEDRTVGARSVVLLRIAADGRCHLLYDETPVACMRGIHPGVVVVVPRRERGSRAEERDGAHGKRTRQSHCLSTSFSSSSRFTPPRSIFFEVSLPASI